MFIDMELFLVVSATMVIFGPSVIMYFVEKDPG